MITTPTPRASGWPIQPRVPLPAPPPALDIYILDGCVVLEARCGMIRLNPATAGVIGAAMIQASRDIEAASEAVPT